MTKLPRARHYAYRQQRYNPIFCSTSEVEMPHLIREYLHNTNNDAGTARNQQKYITSELNANLEQILRTYLSQYWRHEVEREQGGCIMWDEITGFTPRPRRYPPNATSTHSHPDSQWWWQPSFAHDDPSPSAKATPPLSPSFSSPNTTPSSTSSIDSSPNSSPYAVTPQESACAAHAKTRWQLYAERLFALLLRLPNFSFNANMQRLIHMHQEANMRKDTQLADIVRNYLATVLQ